LFLITRIVCLIFIFLAIGLNPTRRLYWNVGIGEYWNDGKANTGSGGPRFVVAADATKRVPPVEDFFQYSTIPLFLSKVTPSFIPGPWAMDVPVTSAVGLNLIETIVQIN
jgi:hypothetical protein